MRRQRIAMLFCAGLAALGAGGCASTDEELDRALIAERDEALNIVSRREVQRQPPGSPQRAVMEMWRAIQFRDAKTVLELLAPRPAPDDVAGVEETIVAAGAPLLEGTKPRIVDVSESGKRAQVTVQALRKQKLGSQPVRRTTIRLEIGLMRTDSAWRVELLPVALQFLQAGSE